MLRGYHKRVVRDEERPGHGATSFLGYHVTKRLNQLGIRPRVLEWPGSDEAVFERLDVERRPGTLADVSAIAAA